MAEAIFRDQASKSRVKFTTIDSAGTGAYHAGDPPDSRTLSTLRAHQINDYRHRARKVTDEDFTKFDYLLAMDEGNLDDLLFRRERLSRAKTKAADKDGGASYGSTSSGARETRGATAAGKTLPAGELADVRLFGDYLEDGNVVKEVGQGKEVDDPYYGGRDGFEVNYRQIVRHSTGFLKFLERKLGYEGAA